LANTKHKPRKRYRRDLRRVAKCRPMLDEIYRVFQPLEHVFNELKRGEITCTAQGVPIFPDDDGTYYEIVPALSGWIDLWQRMDEQCALGIDLKPLTQLVGKLNYMMPLTPDDVQRAYDVINQQRQAYRGMDVFAVKKLVRTQEIAIALHNKIRKEHGIETD